MSTQTFLNGSIATDSVVGGEESESFAICQTLDKSLEQILSSIESIDATAGHPYASTLKLGLRVLMSHRSSPTDQAWADAIDYARAVIISPRDDTSRAAATWKRSCSDLSRVLLSRYDYNTIQAARDGTVSIIADYYGGDRRRIAHVDKRASFMRNWENQKAENAYYLSSSILATAAYEGGTLGCALTLLAWGTPEQAAKLGTLAHLALCDDYYEFTGPIYEDRIRMVAHAIGAAYELGGWAGNAIVDSTLLQASGTGTGIISIESIMSWRAISGCSQPYTNTLFGLGDLEESLVSPTVMMAMHDLYDWRSDTAAANHENGVSAVYGMGMNDPFHAYLEATLKKAGKHPKATIYTISAMTLMHFTASRYGAYEYRGTHRPPCAEQ
ncbi:hypothetical protein HIM_09618 [Hirsutella minnesotensis 3608]|uniref:Uncharacterized protein n=1 Tax=Hirsutella minnesotensis 3608 TaxID=1043627 RepID=A0A0F7ZXN0_9HYPO|nr:hypothetical protein HIM_09618 [Hirsutella minnesotensis 3608]